jgi:hypothetical protein
VKPLEVSFQGRERNEASVAADMNSIGFDCRRMLPVKRGLKLRWCPEVQNCGREQTWRRYTEVKWDAKIEILV